MTQYSINERTEKLSDFWSQSERFVTEHGTRVGMSAAEAKNLEAKKLLPGCGNPGYMHLRWDEHHAFVLLGFHTKVYSITYLGPHTVYYEGLC